MGKGKKSDNKTDKKAEQVCSNCKNFRPGKGDHGRCARRDKKRDATDAACGHFDPKK